MNYSFLRWVHHVSALERKSAISQQLAVFYCSAPTWSGWSGPGGKMPMSWTPRLLEGEESTTESEWGLFEGVSDRPGDLESPPTDTSLIHCISLSLSTLHTVVTVTIAAADACHDIQPPDGGRVSWMEGESLQLMCIKSPFPQSRMPASIEKSLKLVVCLSVCIKSPAKKGRRVPWWGVRVELCSRQ